MTEVDNNRRSFDKLYRLRGHGTLIRGGRLKLYSQAEGRDRGFSHLYSLQLREGSTTDPFVDLIVTANEILHILCAICSLCNINQTYSFYWKSSTTRCRPRKADLFASPIRAIGEFREIWREDWRKGESLFGHRHISCCFIRTVTAGELTGVNLTPVIMPDLQLINSDRAAPENLRIRPRAFLSLPPKRAICPPSEERRIKPSLIRACR